MTEDNGKRQYHPALRAIVWIVPLAAIAVIAVLMLTGGNEDRISATGIAPPVSADIPYMGFAEIDTVIAGANEAFERKNYDETARLLTRARFFIHSGISEGMFDHVPVNLDLVLGLSEFYRGYPLKGILFLTTAVEANPDNETYMWYLGMMHLSQGNRDEAKMWLEKTAGAGGKYSESAARALAEM